MNSFARYRRIGILGLVAIVSMFLAPMSILALDETDLQEYQPVIKDTDSLSLQLEQRTQDPATKEVQLDLIIDSQITSDRARVTWQVTGTSEFIGDYSTKLTIYPGETYVVSARIKPRALGTTEVLVKVEVFEAEGTYLSTASKTIGTYANGEVFPITDDYRLAQVVYYVKIFGIALLVGLFLTVSGFVGYKVFRRWLESE